MAQSKYGDIDEEEIKTLEWVVEYSLEEHPGE